MTATVRKPAVAGMFYPADAGELAHTVDSLLADASGELGPIDHTAPALEAIVAPHAGYVYSGAVAASAYARVMARHAAVERVVLAGPAHRVALTGMAVPTVDFFETPLGAIEIDDELRGRALEMPAVVADDRPHAQEHSLEVHLPFLQRALGSQSWTLLPLVVGHCQAQQVAAVLDAIWGGPETLVVISTDLSHYHRYAEAVALDRRTAAAIVAADVGSIEPDLACGSYPLRGLLTLARERGLEVDLLDLRNSGDTAGPNDRVVGYGAFALWGT